MEDSGLAAHGAEGGYRIHDLLAYSAVCGLGLDTVPVAGDVPPASSSNSSSDSALSAMPSIVLCIAQSSRADDLEPSGGMDAGFGLHADFSQLVSE